MELQLNQLVVAIQVPLNHPETAILHLHQDHLNLLETVILPPHNLLEIAIPPPLNRLDPLIPPHLPQLNPVMEAPLHLNLVMGAPRLYLSQFNLDIPL